MKAQKVLIAAMVAASALLSACAEEVSHTESDKHGWFGDHKHVEDTTYRNPDGSLSHEHQEIKVNP